MLRLLSLSICATFLTCALAQSSGTTTIGPAPTPTPVPPQTTTEGPTSGPTQAPQFPTNYSYSENNVVCIRLVGNITVYIEYVDINDHKVILDPVNLADIAFVSDDDSSCSESKANIVLGFNFLGDEPPVHFLNFSFQKASDVWNSSDLTYTFDATTVGPNVTVNVTGDVVLTSSGLFSENVDKGGSYMCKAPQNITFNSSHIHYYINATVGIVGLQVQAFMTKDEKGQFGLVSYDCANDQGNKIVPIAVGAALAGLVIVVLIAYLIGRLKSRRQNSYEPLS